jgi:hypothetical protein
MGIRVIGPRILPKDKLVSCRIPLSGIFELSMVLHWYVSAVFMILTTVQYFNKCLQDEAALNYLP